MATATQLLTAFLREQPPVPVHESKPPSEEAIRARLDRAREHEDLHALLSVLVERDTSFELFELRMYPAVLAREPWKDGVMTDRDLCVAKNGAGDLHLWNMDERDVRMVVHDEGWRVSDGEDTFEDWLHAALYAGLENVEADDLDEMDDVQHARVRLAVEAVGADGMRAEARAKLVELGIVPA